MTYKLVCLPIYLCVCFWNNIRFKIACLSKAYEINSILRGFLMAVLYITSLHYNGYESLPGVKREEH